MIAWPISQKQTSKNNHLFLDNTSQSSKHCFNNKDGAQEFNNVFAANVKKRGFQSRLTLIVINRSLISAFNLYINK